MSDTLTAPAEGTADDAQAAAQNASGPANAGQSAQAPAEGADDTAPPGSGSAAG